MLQLGNREVPMTLTLDLPTDLESKLAAEAAGLGLPLSEYVVRLLAEDRPPNPPRGRVRTWSPIGRRRDSSPRGRTSRTVRHTPAPCGNKPSSGRGRSRWTSLIATC